MIFPGPEAEAIAAEIAPQVRALQIIHATLVASVTGFLGYVAAKGLQFSADPDVQPDIPLVCAATQVVLSFVVPPIVRRTGLAAVRGTSPLPVASLMAPFQTGHIVGMAMLEGAGFICCFTLMGGFGGAPRWFLAVPIAVIALMVVRFPRRDAVAEWIAAAREELTS